MGEAKRKAGLPPLISVLIPVRGRPDETLACIRSMVGDPRVEILVAVDADDQDALQDYTIGDEGGTPYDIRTLIWDRPPTLGDKLNRLAQKAKGDILFFLANDYVMATPDWADRMRAAVTDLPNGVGVIYPSDSEHPGHASFPIVTRKMVEIMGYFVPPFFPYWFVDTWLDEIGILTQTKREIDVTVQHQGARGDSHGLVDLVYWRDFFSETRPMRVKTAIDLLLHMYGPDTPDFNRVMANLQTNQNLCQNRLGQLYKPEVIAYWESKQASPPSEHYPKVKQEAANMLAALNAQKPKRVRVALCIPSTETWRSRTATDVLALTAFSTLHGIDVAIINVESSMISNSRNGIAEIALNNKSDYLLWIDSDMRFPHDALLRLLKHNKDIVGCVYNKKVAPFETLGKFAGEMPADGHISGGLHEALLLPGGFMLVKADVYRQMKWPCYFETLRWPGATGLDGFKEMLRCSYRDRPTEDVLDSLDGTALGEWLKDNYMLGEKDEPFLYWSEDFGFCRKARRYGYKIWCDVDLSMQLSHLGTLEVTTLDPKVPTKVMSASLPTAPKPGQLLGVSDLHAEVAATASAPPDLSPA